MMSNIDVLKSLISISCISLHMGLVSRSSMSTAYVRLAILVMYNMCVSAGAGCKVVVIILVRRSLAAVMLSRILVLVISRLDVLESWRGVGPGGSLAKVKAVSKFLRVGAGLT